MRAKRPLRKTGPSFDLPQLKSNAPEVQVQQKNEQELNKFFIDVDDNTVSPMVTTDPSFRGGSFSNLNSLADLTSLDGPSSPRGAARAASGARMDNNAGSRPSVLAGHPGEAKFIHVNNTNIFVLIDGISMFVEGMSTFTGTEDAQLLTERIRQKRAAARSLDTVGEAILNIEMTPDGGVRETTSPSTGLTTKGPTGLVVGIASLPGGQPLSAGTLPPLLEDPQPSASVSEWSLLFTHATKLVDPPLFRLARASTPILRPRISDTTAVANSPLAGSGSTPMATAASSPSASQSSAAVQSLTNAVTPTSALSNAAGFAGIARLPISSNSPTLGRHDSSSSILSVASGLSSRAGAAARKQRRITADEIGHSNRSFDMDEVVIEERIGKGTQGTVFCVRVDGKVYAMKCMNIDEAMNATNDVERQGRKKGLVKELTMIKLQQSRPPPEYLMQMFNAVASLDVEQKQLSILLELMSFTVESLQQMVSRMPKGELMGVSQSTFRKYIAGDPAAKRLMLDRRADQKVYGSARHAVGRNSYNEPAEWEWQVQRETPMPEVFLSILAHDVLKGLQELHSDYFIVHCDLKPANVLLDYDQVRFKLADFGCGCVMEDKQRVERRGIDLGSMLYKAPERFTNSILQRDEDLDDGLNVETVVEFTAKADVWSLGIMLLELASGVHPCAEFKSDFWNYGNLLKLSKMAKPLSWSEFFYDFILRSVCVDVEKRWSVTQLLRHPFIVNYNYIPRAKLKQFVQCVETDSKSFHKRQQSELLKEQITLSTTRRHRDTYRQQSAKCWGQYTAFLKRAPSTADKKMFPQLPTL